MDMRSAELVVPVVMQDRLNAAAERRFAASLRCGGAPCQPRRGSVLGRLRQLRFSNMVGALAIPSVN